MIKDVTMIDIRAVPELKNKFLKIEEKMNIANSPIFIAKNKYEDMSIEQYSSLTDSVERRLDEADKYAEECKVRYSKDEVFNRIRGRIGAL